MFEYYPNVIMKTVVNTSVFNDMVTKKRDHMNVYFDQNDLDDIDNNYPYCGSNLLVLFSVSLPFMCFMNGGSINVDWRQVV
ncbi:MAG: hypothetical protein Ta2E_11060 [Mycoplasmoidaceae bacterium]|nr:MAG: hypothetical protein Ta2E_11060 [Mycoplasmoidaceae bacterium]